MDATEKPLTERQEAVLRNVKFQECPTASEVGQMLHISTSAAQTALNALEKRGLVHKAGYASTGARAWALVSKKG